MDWLRSKIRSDVDPIQYVPSLDTCMRKLVLWFDDRSHEYALKSKQNQVTVTTFNQ